MRYLTLPLLFILLVSCKKEIITSEASKSTKQADIDIAPSEELVLKSQKNTKELKSLLSLFTKRKYDIEEKLESLSPEEANKLYVSYIIENSKTVTHIQEQQSHMLKTDNYYSYFYNDNGDPITPPDSIAIKEVMLEKAGLELWEIGEGLTDIRTQPDFYLNIFDIYVTEDYRDFIKLEAEHSKVLYSSDAALAISLEDLGKRILDWENFLLKYPDSNLIKYASDYYTYYQLDYLFGLDNTPTMEYPNTKLYPENVIEFNRFTSKNPGSFTSKLVKIVLDNTKNYDALHNEIKEEQVKYLKHTGIN